MAGAKPKTMVVMDQFSGVAHEENLATRIAEIPDKLVFRIGEVSQIVGVEAYVLRYWESEFRRLAPRKSSSGQRMFRKKDVELLLRIRHLLYERKFTIDGARRFLAEQGGVNSGSEVSLSAQQELFPDANPLSEIRKEVAEILRMVSDG